MNSAFYEFINIQYCKERNMSSRTQDTKKILIVGLPNTGKSLTFTNLTGEYAVAANSPMTTIQMKRARLTIGNQPYEVIDTPGLHYLRAFSEEEIQVRNFIFAEEPDVILQCIDANRLKQSLTLTVDLLALDLPLIISLNAIDETSRKGVWIDSDKLSRYLGVPVIESVAVQAKGIGALKDAVLKARAGKWEVPYDDSIKNSLKSIEFKMPPEVPYKRMVAQLVLMEDPFIAQYLEKIYDGTTVAGIATAAKNVNREFRGSLSRTIIEHRNRWIDDIFEKVVKKQKIAPKEISQTFARYSRHPVFGIFILLAVIYMMFYLVVNVANVMAAWMNDIFWIPVETVLGGVLPQGFWQDFFIGEYGVLSLGLANALLTVLPILSVFFLMFNILEDVGYIPNLSVLTKRLLDKLGLSVGALMPLVLGFGCKTMATLTTRSLHSRKERYIAIYVIAFAIPCAAQFGLNMSILGWAGTSAFVLATAVLTSIGIAACIVLNKLLKEKAEKIAFIQELPPIRLPNLAGVLKKTYYRLYWFLKESLMVFVYAALALFVADRLGLLDAAKRALSPVIEGMLGLPLAMVDAIILCFVRREAAAGLVIDLVRTGQLDYVQCIVAVIITTTFAPCFATIMAISKEIGGKTTVAMLFSICLSAFVTAGALNWALVTLL